MRILKDTLEAEPTRQKFSSTDLNKSITNSPGIVYPLANGNNQLSVSSIIDHNRNQRVELAHNEARICNLEGNTIHYSKGRCIGFVRDKIQITPPSEAEKLFGVPEKVSGTNGYFITDEANITKFVESISTIWEQIDYKPSTDFIKADNLVEKAIPFPFIPSQKKYRKETNLFPLIADEVLFDVKEDLQQPHYSHKNSNIPKLVSLEEFASFPYKRMQEYLIEIYDSYYGITIHNPRKELGNSPEKLKDIYIEFIGELPS